MTYQPLHGKKTRDIFRVQLWMRGWAAHLSHDAGINRRSREPLKRHTGGGDARLRSDPVG